MGDEEKRTKKPNEDDEKKPEDEALKWQRERLQDKLDYDLLDDVDFD